MKWSLSFAQHLNLQNGLITGLMWGSNEICESIFYTGGNLYTSHYSLSPLDVFKESECIGFVLMNRNRVSSPMTGPRELLFHFCCVRRQQKATSSGTEEVFWPDTSSLIFCCPASILVSKKFLFHMSELKHQSQPKQTMIHILTN